jgi:hypothetical protein
VVAHADVQAAGVLRVHQDAHPAGARVGAVAVGVQDGVRRRLADGQLDLHHRVLWRATLASDLRDRPADRRDL